MFFVVSVCCSMVDWVWVWQRMVILDGVVLVVICVEIVVVMFVVFLFFVLQVVIVGGFVVNCLCVGISLSVLGCLCISVLVVVRIGVCEWQFVFRWMMVVLGW